ncbi:cell wall hydrolase/autolysin [Actinomyces sp. oral taxon 178 str. F0338]|nr:cell wall hydrolase/autolysin [Actinomyces sp. oral taxon 178 str. F0338]
MRRAGGRPAPASFRNDRPPCGEGCRNPSRWTTVKEAKKAGQAMAAHRGPGTARTTQESRHE